MQHLVAAAAKSRLNVAVQQKAGWVVCRLRRSVLINADRGLGQRPIRSGRVARTSLATAEISEELLQPLHQVFAAGLDRVAMLVLAIIETVGALELAKARQNADEIGDRFGPRARPFARLRGGKSFGHV